MTRTEALSRAAAILKDIGIEGGDREKAELRLALALMEERVPYYPYVAPYVAPYTVPWIGPDVRWGDTQWSDGTSIPYSPHTTVTNGAN